MTSDPNEDRLDRDWRQAFFRPQSVALVGASERSTWSRLTASRFAMYQFRGRLFAVNTKGLQAHGLPAYRSCAEIPEPVDLAIIMVNASSVEDALRDVGAAGIANAVIISSGFSEIGHAGQALQDRLVEVAGECGVRFMGPNSLGFANIAAHLVATTIPARQPLCIGSVGIVSQSGLLLSDLARFAHQQNIGLSTICAPGNAAMIDAIDVIEYMIDDAATRAILAYIEAEPDLDRFRAAAARALAARKPIVVYKAGGSELSAATAKAHTGSVVGDDRVFDAMCREFGVIRARSIEEMVTTGGLIEFTGALPPEKGVALLTISGGAAVMYVNIAEHEGLPVPALAVETLTALRDTIPAFATPANPMDITGGVFGKEEMWSNAIRALARDPAIGLVVTLLSVPETESESKTMAPSWPHIVEGYRAAAMKGVVIDQILHPVTAFTQQFMGAWDDIKPICGLSLATTALAHLHRWSQAVHGGHAASMLSDTTEPSACDL